jgi:hypothetical protein
MKKEEMSIQDWKDLNRFLDNEDTMYRASSMITSDVIEAITHILKVIEKKSVQKCSEDTQESYVVLKDLKNKLKTDYVIYRP